jgi:DNA-binding transcriptional LysR family regulator
MDVHVRDLRYFVAVAEELHFTGASELLHISQPSLSKQIRVLERDLGFSLFQRDRRTVALTEAGEALLPRARALLSGWDEALSPAELVVAWRVKRPVIQAFSDAAQQAVNACPIPDTPATDHPH